MKIQFLIAELEGTIHGAPRLSEVANLSDDDLRRLEAGAYRWQGAALTELGRRVQDRFTAIAMGQGKSFSGVRQEPAHE